MREAQAHFERAKILDPDNAVANVYLEKVLLPLWHIVKKPLKAPQIPVLVQSNQAPDYDSDGEDASMNIENTSQCQKRARV